jgi:hypothetical protein
LEPTIKQNYSGAGGMAQVAESLPSKCKPSTSNPNPRTAKKEKKQNTFILNRYKLSTLFSLFSQYSTITTCIAFYIVLCIMSYLEMFEI